MKNNAVVKSQEVRTRMLATALLVTLVALASIRSFGESSRPHVAGAFEHKGAQALLENNPPAHVEQPLPSEMDVAELAPLAHAWTEAPKHTFQVTTVRDNKSLKVAVHEVGTGSKVIVCVHGLFSDNTNWRYIAGALRDEYQLWLVDLPGCGESESPIVPKNDLATYSPEALADRTLQAVEARLAERPDVSRFMIAGHSLGGMVTLRMFSDDAVCEQHAATLARVDGLALFAPCDVLVTQATPDWLTFLALNSFKVEIGSTLGMIHSAMVDSMRGSFCNSNAATRELVAQGEALLKNRPQRRANQAIMFSATPWKEFGTKPDFDKSEQLETNYGKVHLPCLVVWGGRDMTLQSSMGYKLKDKLPNARMVEVGHSMHLLTMEQPAVCAGLIRDFERQLHGGELAPVHSVKNLSPDSLDVIAQVARN